MKIFEPKVFNRNHARLVYAGLIPFLVIGLLLVGCFMPQNKGTREKITTENIASKENYSQRMKGKFELLQVGVLFKQKGYAIIILIISIY